MSNQSDKQEREHKVLSLSAYWKELCRHDWYYDYSDDYYRVVLPGAQNQRRMEDLAQQGPAHTDLYRAFHRHFFPWKYNLNETPPLPQNPDPQLELDLQPRGSRPA